MEVDSTFYGPPPRRRFEGWRERTPDGFTLAVKMPGEVTHELRLTDPRPALAFCADARALGPRLGPLLVQLPPDLGPAAFDTLDRFLAALPDDLRFAIEFRDRAWLGPGTFDLLADHGVSLALGIGPWLPEAEAREAATAAPGRALYLRWFGAPHEGGAAEAVKERDREVQRWARLIPDLEVDEVYAFFNDDYQGHAPASARRLQQLLGQTPVAPDRLSPQRELFG